jgi:hypothetical protein
VMAVMKELPDDFQQWQRRWNTCIKSGK